MATYLANDVVKALKEKNIKISTAESCTGGMLATSLTSISGASHVFDRGFITYSNESKIETLGVNPHILEKFGAVSAETVSEMAKGAVAFSKADIGIAITGIAGPDSSEFKPVGLVYIAIADMTSCHIREFTFTGTRDAIRQATVSKTLELLLRYTMK